MLTDNSKLQRSSSLSCNLALTSHFGWKFGIFFSKLSSVILDQGLRYNSVIALGCTRLSKVMLC